MVCGWLGCLDIVALYSLRAELNPRVYLEVGSGFSTQFARRAISDHGLRTRIISIDPRPRADVDDVCDEVIRRPLEDVDLTVFDRLGAGDAVFVDGSHRSFTNSDATVMFLDVLPGLESGVHVGFHDIRLPDDYPPEWWHRFYSEQYLLAAYLLAEGTKFDITFPAWFIGGDEQLSQILAPLWNDGRLTGIVRDGSSFWIRMR